jgi:AraC-like DNA-binding protein
MLWSMEAAPNASTDWHAHAVHELVYCLDGKGALETSSGSVALAPGWSYLVPAGVSHRFVFQPEESARLRVVCLDAAETATYLSPAQSALLAELRTTVPSMADHTGERDTLEQLLDYILAGSGAAAQDVQVRWSSVGLLLALHGKARLIPSGHLWQRYHARMLTVRNWLDQHLDQSISLEALATSFGLSRSLLTREFKRHVGYSVVDYCNLRRAERAAQILVSGTLSVTQAAYEAGFTNISHFHRQFKAVFGMTPAGFRRQIAGGNADVV